MIFLKDLYPICLVTKAKLESLSLSADVSDHVQEMDLIISMYEKNSLSADKEQYIVSVVEDALKDAAATIAKITA